MKPQVTRFRVRLYQITTVIWTGLLLAVAWPLEGVGALFGFSLIAQFWHHRRLREQHLKYLAGLDQDSDYARQMQSLQSGIQDLRTGLENLNSGFFETLDVGRKGCPTCGSTFLKYVLSFSEKTLCTQLRDIHPHYVNDPVEDPNPWAWSWYQYHGYAPPPVPCSQIYQGPEIRVSDPIAYMKAQGHRYWSEHRNHLWDIGYAESPDWYKSLFPSTEGTLPTIKTQTTTASPTTVADKPVSPGSRPDFGQRPTLPTTAEEEKPASSLYPRRLTEFAGQVKLKESLSVAIEAAKGRGETLDHVLLYGESGVGKATLSMIIANEMGVDYQAVSTKSLQKGDLNALLTNAREKQVLFFEEFDWLRPSLEDLLCMATEEFKLDLIVGQGPSSRTHTLDLKSFTLIASTSRSGSLSPRLRKIFNIVGYLSPYDEEEIATLVIRSARLLGIEIDEDAARAIAARSKGIPRAAHRLLRRVRDYAEVRSARRIDSMTARAALSFLESDGQGIGL